MANFMKILLFGCDPVISIAAVEQLNALGHDVLYATNKRRLNGVSGSVTCLAYDNITSDKTFEAAKKFSPDYILSIIFEDKIPDRIIETAKYHALNFHPALLPDVRTGDAWYWSIFIATTHSAICVHKLTSSWDSGDIAYEHTFPMHKQETLGSYLDKVQKQMPKTIEAIHEMIAHQGFTFKPQVDGTYYPKPRWGDIYIDWQYSAVHIEKMVRAGNPNMPALAFFVNKEVQINEVKLTEQAVETSPGTITVIDNKLYIATSDHMLEITILTIMGVGIYSGERAIELFNIASGQRFININDIDRYNQVANSSLQP